MSVVKCLQYAGVQYEISLTKDAAAGVWTATSDMIPGLILEAATVEKLMERVYTAIPELLLQNPEKR